MSGFDNYDQWKTASPYDDEPDIIEEATRFLDEHSDDKPDPEMERARMIIELLLEEL